MRDLKTFARTKISGRRLKQSLRQVLIVQGDNAIRVDTFGLFGQVLGVLVHQGERTFLYDPEKDRVIRGQEVSDMMRKVMGFSIDFREYIRVFSGGIPRISHLQATAAGWDPEKTRYRVDAIDTGTDERVTIDIDPYTLLPVALTRRKKTRERVRVFWDDYRKVEGWDFAHRIVIELRDRDETVTVNYSEPLINQGLAPDAFELIPQATESDAANRKPAS